MAFENRRWLVIPVSIIDNIDFNQVHESDIDSLRKSINGELTFIKYEVNVVEEDYTTTFHNLTTGKEETTDVKAGVYGRPSVYSTDYTEYNHADILTLLDTDDWSKEINK